jgi:hypothetical protein
MIVKQEDFQTAEGISGLKSYGFSRLNENTNSRDELYYEIVLFSQNGGLQQILIFHEQGDSYADKIAERFKFC